MLIKRRQILQGMTGLAVTPMFLHSMSAEAAGANNTIVVTINMSGGNDGLNTVIPLSQYGTYKTLRTPATPPSDSVALAYTTDALAATRFEADPSVSAANAQTYAFNPSMTAMRDLYATGHLAVIAGVGLPHTEPNAQSHEVASLDWQTGHINPGTVAPPGWLALTLEGAKSGPIGSTVSMTGGSPALLVGGKTQALTLYPPIDNFDISYSTSDNHDKLVSSSKRILALPAANSTAAYDQAIINGAIADIAAVRTIANAAKGRDYPAPASWLDYQLREIARMIVGGAGVRGYYAEQGGYDTHSQQNLSHPKLLADLGNAIQTFFQYLKANSAAGNVLIMTISDFGRRPGANLDFGTDHGGGTVSFVLGSGVKGGVYGSYPNLRKLDPYGNLSAKVDFRNLISDVVTAMGGNATTVIGQTYPKLGFI